MTTRPSKSGVAILCPSSVTRMAGGAVAPTRSSLACADDPHRPSQVASVAAQPFSNARRDKNANDASRSEVITCADADGVSRKELIAVEIAVNGHLYEPEDMQLSKHFSRQARAYVSDVTGRALDVGKRTLVAGLVQQVHL